MTDATHAPLVLVLHGATGDLARRMVLPAIYTLASNGFLPERFALVGTGAEDVGVDAFRARVVESLTEFGGVEDPENPDVVAFLEHLSFAGPVTVEDAGTLPERISQASGGDAARVVHYLAVPPSAFDPITRALAAHDLAAGIRVVYEKPYGTSPESFEALDAVVHEVFDEEQVYRIDHFLAKEATQNLYVLRFANELFGGMWNRNHIAQVQIDVPEELDVAQRATFYDATGAALDMLVTHLFQVAAEIGMEPPYALDAAGLAKSRERVLADFRAVDPEHDLVFGQFDGYQDIDAVAEGSRTDTYVAARLWIDNDRWSGVPFVLRTGKRMATSGQRVTLVLRSDREMQFGEPSPGEPEVSAETAHLRCNTISVSLAGSGSISLRTTVKRPGHDLVLANGTAQLDLASVAPGRSVPPYAALLYDVVKGDRSLFPTPENLRQAWRAFAPVLAAQAAGSVPVHPYAPGSWGPAEADALTQPYAWQIETNDSAGADPQTTDPKNPEPDSA